MQTCWQRAAMGVVIRLDERLILKTESYVMILANNETGYNIILLVITKVIL